MGNDIPVVWVADIGSVRRKRFGWHRIPEDQDSDRTDIVAFAGGIANDLLSGRSVALGFECPIFVPVPREPEELTAPRGNAEKRRPWSAGAGCAVLATGLSECAWVFDKIYEMVGMEVRPSLIWEDFIAGKANLFVWEAFVTGEAKGSSHSEDAKTAAQAFLDRYPDIQQADAIKEDKPWYSLVGAALLRSGLSRDISILSRKCIVIRS